MKAIDAAYGVAFDGDGDRLVIIQKNGNIIWPDQLMILFSKSILAKYKNAKIVYDVKCTQNLKKTIQDEGGIPFESRTGHSYIKQTIKKESAKLGGEMSGHIFFNDKWYGFDDGHYAAVRIAEILTNSDKNVSELINEFPQSFSTPELNITVTDETKFSVIEDFEKNCNLDGEKITIDGLRVNFKNGWGLIRASNTTPKLVLRFEGDSLKEMNEIKDLFLSELSRICPNIDINLD
jgi:phosphomannomutase/phosphoglucomutase